MSAPVVYITQESVVTHLTKNKKVIESVALKDFYHSCQELNSKDLKKVEFGIPDYWSVKQWTGQAYQQSNSSDTSMSNAICSAYRILLSKNKITDFKPSRRYLHNKIKKHDKCAALEYVSYNGNPHFPATIEDGFSQILYKGVCSGNSCPSNPAKIDEDVSCYDVEATEHRVNDCFQLDTKNRNSLIENIELMILAGIPVIGLFNVYRSFETPKNGFISMPNPSKWIDSNNNSKDVDKQDPYLGGHFMVIVGYSREYQMFTVMNSFGPNWGINGFAYMPYAYMVHPKLGLEFTVLI